MLKRLTDGPVNLCISSDAIIAGNDVSGVKPHKFKGPHPSGLAGTHIHFLDPVSINKTVWVVGYQDVLAIGALFITGHLDTQRVVALCGPQACTPRLVRTRIGANINELVASETLDGDNRVISGSILSGRTASVEHAGGVLSFLGRYHSQITVILEGYQREFFRYVSYSYKKNLR